jgi:hypothetical protein
VAKVVVTDIVTASNDGTQQGERQWLDWQQLCPCRHQEEEAKRQKHWRFSTSSDHCTVSQAFAVLQIVSLKRSRAVDRLAAFSL